MEIKSIKPLRGSRVLITLDNGLSFPLYEREAGQFQLQEEAPITQDMISRITDEILIPRAKKKAVVSAAETGLHKTAADG